MATGEITTYNELLRRAGPRATRGLREFLEPVKLAVGTVLYSHDAVLSHAYFPASGLLSGLVVMSDGAAIEVSAVGHEGMWSVALLQGIRRLPYRVIVQAPLSGWRIAASHLQAETAANTRLQEVFRGYQEYLTAHQAQSAACNGLHSVQRRCCRWLLTNRDGLGTDRLPLTHEFLAFLLGTRRASVTDVLRPLHDRGLIRAGRGVITILDRVGLEQASCECYQVLRDAYQRYLPPAPAR
jgi:CRP-like cAMP-binding protein